MNWECKQRKPFLHSEERETEEGAREGRVPSSREQRDKLSHCTNPWDPFHLRMFENANVDKGLYVCSSVNHEERKAEDPSRRGRCTC